MTTTLQDTDDLHVRALQERRAQLEHRVKHYSALARDSNGADPSGGRELDGARSLLAQVHAELALLWARGGDGPA